MNPKIKKKWLTALRSGKYKQGKEALNADNKFCCLGVLCDIYAKEKKLRWKKLLHDSQKVFINEQLHLPSSVQIWAELSSANPVIENRTIKERTCEDLAQMNDAGLSFDEIADIIEKEL